GRAARRGDAGRGALRRRLGGARGGFGGRSRAGGADLRPARAPLGGGSPRGRRRAGRGAGVSFWRRLFGGGEPPEEEVEQAPEPAPSKEPPAPASPADDPDA